MEWVLSSRSEKLFWKLERRCESGRMEFWFETGETDERGAYNDAGQKHGKWEDFNESGILISEGSYEKGIPDGKWVYYFPNGSIQREQELDLGMLDGRVMTYARNGKVLEEANYKMNKLDGKFIIYNERTGKSENHLIYENGQVVKVILSNSRK
mgnify:CR=1 FL=1